MNQKTLEGENNQMKNIYIFLSPRGKLKVSTATDGLKKKKGLKSNYPFQKGEEIIWS